MAYGTSHYGTAIYGALGEEEDHVGIGRLLDQLGEGNDLRHVHHAHPIDGFISESFRWNKNRNDGKGMRVGSIVNRASRTTVTSASGAGEIDMLLASRGLGLLWEAFCGNSVSNLVSGSARTSSSTSWRPPGTAVGAEGHPQRGTNTIDPNRSPAPS